MESGEMASDTAASSTFDIDSGGNPPPSLTPADDVGTISQVDYVESPISPVKNDQNLHEYSAPSFADTIEELEGKVAKLKEQLKADPTHLKSGSSRPGLSSDMDKLERMEEILYKNRKAWERKVGVEPWRVIDTGPRSYFRPHGVRWEDSKWRVNWKMRYDNEYERPTIDNLADRMDEHRKTEAEDYDNFDHAIDYGDRRDRLRKCFEWELDRLYLNEEMDLRQRERDGLGKNLQSDQDQGSTANKLPTASSIAKAKLQKLDWLPFRRLRFVQEMDACVMDILVGEPKIENDSFAGHFRRPSYGYPLRRAVDLDVTAQDHKAVPLLTPGQPPLPERIRIHSRILIQILDHVLGSTVEGWQDSTIVITRPFKLLIHCEKALRDWYRALENKFVRTAQEQVNDPVTEDNPGIVSPEGVPTSNDSVKDQALRSTGDTVVLEDTLVNRLSGEPGDRRLSDQSIRDLPDHEDPSKFTEESRQEEEETEPEFSAESKDSDTEDEVDADDPDDPTKSEMALNHLKCLIEFMDSDILAKRAYLESPNCRKILFSDLWLFFRPGMEVIGSDGKQAYRIVNVNSVKHSVTGLWEWYNLSRNSGTKRKKPAPFSITCIFIDFDGKHLGPVKKVFEFKRFDGEKDVTSLEVYPIRCYRAKPGQFSDAERRVAETLPESQRYRMKLLRRGASFLEAAAVKHAYYTGMTVEHREEIESHVVIDFETAFAVEDESQKQWKPVLESLVESFMTTEDTDDDDEDDDERSCTAQCCLGETVYDDSGIDSKQRNEYINSILPNKNTPNEQPSIAIIPRPLVELRDASGHVLVSDDELLIMSYRVFGFVLRSRKWAKLDLTNLSNPYEVEQPAVVEGKEQHSKEEIQSAFDRLVLENWHRDMIVSLISQHFREKEARTGRSEDFDIVKGKGKGLILLLHGAPGVGKTSTAEGVAELFKKPLFQITCGDLGTTAPEVEKALETNFSLANKWGCILLLDEADVFLAQRTKEDFKRNGLVAVFLRVMEYYAGILFLTTNRVGDFDEAFASRIHISLYYPQLDNRKTVDVFTINMDMIAERCRKRGRVIDIDKIGIGGFAAKHFAEFPQARWNGRQIRNACQSALALAEFEAQGNSHTAVMKPDAIVKLQVKHFEIVRDAYIEFTKYMNDIYGSSASTRAKENYLRAVWVDENDRVVNMKGMGPQDLDEKKAAFLFASQNQTPVIRQQHHPPQQTQYPQQQHQYGLNPYQNFTTSQTVYPDSGYTHSQANHFPVSQPWNTGTMDSNIPMQPSGGQSELLNPQPQVMTPLQQQQRQQQQQQQFQQPPSLHPGFSQDVRSIYAASGSGQQPPI